MTPFDLIERAKRAKSVEELIALAREDKIELSEEDARIYFERWHEAELSEDDLDAATGGMGEANESSEAYACEFCGSGNLGTILTGGFYCYDCNRHCTGKKL